MYIIYQGWAMAHRFAHRAPVCNAQIRVYGAQKSENGSRSAVRNFSCALRTGSHFEIWCAIRRIKGSI